MYHGNLELLFDEVSASRLSPGSSEFIRQRRQQAPYRERRVTVEATVSPQEGRFVVRDQGPGFDTANMTQLADPARLASNERRGLVLIKLFMDQISFSAQGNEITLVKRQRTESMSDKADPATRR